MFRITTTAWVLAFGLLLSNSVNAQLAITEALIFPEGNDLAEYIEIVNHSGSTVDLSGYHVATKSLVNGTPDDVFTFPGGASIAADERILLTPDIKQFRRHFPGVFELAQVFQADGAIEDTGVRLDNDVDELLILDPTFDPTNPADDPDDNIVWNLGYDLNDATPEVTQGTAFHLAGSNNFAVTDYGRTTGVASGPFTVFGGNDLTTPAVIGYEAADDATNGDPAAGAQGFRANFGSPGNVGVFGAPTSISENFSAWTLGTIPDENPLAPWTGGSGPGTSIVADTGNLFSNDSSNQYFRLVDDNMNGGIEEIKAEGFDLSNLATIQFDIHEPSIAPNPSATGRARLVTRLFSADAGGLGTDARIIDLRWEDGTVETGGSGVPGDTTSASYALDTTLTVVIITNNTDATVMYDDGQGGMTSLGDDKYDVWVGPKGGTLVNIMDDNFVRGGQFLDPVWDFSAISFRTFSGDDNVEAFLDNINVFQGASLAAPSTPGDFDGDGDVDGTDFLIAQRGSDPAADIAEWAANYPDGGSLSTLAAAVPEPTSLWLVVAMSLSVATRRARP